MQVSFFFVYTDALRRESQLHTCTQLVYLFCNSLMFQPKTYIQGIDDRLIKNVLKSLKCAASSIPLNVSLLWYNIIIGL